ncbi:MAG TPA: AAA family ATPase [Oryzihumus sp.]|nr:AAA family ATPase [Oryzihumus sp.]
MASPTSQGPHPGQQPGPPPGPVPAADALDRAVALVAAAEPRCGTTVVVAVDGPSGSGKSTFAASLAARLGGTQVVRMDDIYPGWDGLEAAVALLRDDVLAPLARGDRAAYRRFDWERGTFAEAHEVPAAPVLVVEGVGSGARACAPWLSVLVWMEASPEVRHARGMDRDGETYRPHWERWAAQERTHFAAEETRRRADLVVDTDPAPAGA